MVNLVTAGHSSVGTWGWISSIGVGGGDLSGNDNNRLLIVG